MKTPEIIEILKKYVEFEIQVAEDSENTAKEIGNTLICDFIQIIALDSLKHAKLLEAAIKLLSKDQLNLTSEDKEKTQDLIKRHKEIEDSAINYYSELIKEFKDENHLKLIFQYILSDERRHHAVFSKLSELKGTQTIGDDAIWSLFWQYTNLAELSLERLTENNS